MEKLYTLDDANSPNIKIIAYHFLTSGLSLRLFAKKYCDFSYVTLRTKLLSSSIIATNDLILKQIKEKLAQYKAKNIDEDDIARQRTLRAIELLLKENLTIIEIAEILNSSEMTIYRDLTKRAFLLSEIDVKTKREILFKLKEHSKNNLSKKGR